MNTILAIKRHLTDILGNEGYLATIRIRKAQSIILRNRSPLFSVIHAENNGRIPRIITND